MGRAQNKKASIWFTSELLLTTASFHFHAVIEPIKISLGRLEEFLQRTNYFIIIWLI